MTTADEKSYSYDNAGSVTSVYNSTTGITTTLSYDGESRLTAASNNPGSGAYSDTFAYNGMDQRYAKSDSTGSFGYTRAGDEVDDAVLSDGAAVYNHGAGDDLISEVRSSTSKFYHSDALGTTGALTNSSGTTTDTLVTDAFGMKVTGSGSTPSPFGFVGQGGYQGDNDTGLMLLGYRYYDNSTGRFLSRDPIQAGRNWYSYCENDPINGADPEGLLTKGQVAGGIVTAVIAGSCLVLLTFATGGADLPVLATIVATTSIGGFAGGVGGGVQSSVDGTDTIAGMEDGALKGAITGFIGGAFKAVMPIIKALAGQGGSGDPY